MSISVVYVFPTHPAYLENAERFVASYNTHPAGTDHSLIVVSNGGPPTVDMRAILAALVKEPEIFQHDNSGYDIGAFQAVARARSTDKIMVFFGSSAYLRGPGWLFRMVIAVDRQGTAALFGTHGNNGDSRVNVSPHVRTTGFWLSPMLLNMYPLKVTQPNQRYEFEHGPNCLANWCRAQGYRVFVVTWDGEYEWPSWDSIPNGFHRGDQSALLCGDRLTLPPYYPYP